ncbi:gp53-like domain-containing protein [Citrobacter freundii]
MAINNFKPFATAANANVTTQDDWEALPALLSGFMAGKASSAQVNKAIRQASFIAAALAQYTANKSGQDVLDNGDLNGFITKMSAAFGKDFQALDATLTALAGLATGANKLPYFTGTDTASQTDLTSVGRDIIGKSTIADVLTYLGLTAITTVAGATDSFPYFSGPNSARLTPLTDFARNLLSKPDDIDARTALGLGSAATKAVGNGSGQIPDISFFGRSLDNAGYFLLPSSVVVQWGRVTISGSTVAHITYPIPFPNKRFVLAASPIGSGFTVNPATPVFTEGDRTGCDVSSWGTSNYTALYIAIGG